MARFPSWDREKLARRGWRIRLRLAQVARVALRGSGAVTATLVALATLELAAVGWILTRAAPAETAAALGLRPIGLLALLLGTALAVLALGALAAGALTLRVADPRAWSRATVAGRPFAEVLRTLAREVRATCRRFERRAAALERAVGEPGPARTPDELRARVYRGEVKIRTALARLTRSARASQAGVQRLVRGFEVAGDEHGIPYDRLCRYVLQYTPRVQHELVRRYLENWQEILSRCELSTDADAPGARLLPLAAQNRRILGEARRCARRAEELADNEDLHPFVESFASHHSTSGSVLRYAQALTAVARRAARELERARGPERRAAVLARTVARLRFLHQRQLGWAGIGLHAGCRNVCAARLEREPDDETALRGIVSVLDALADGDAGGRDPAVLGDDDRARRRALEHLLHLEPIVAAEIERAREDLAARFEREAAPLVELDPAAADGPPRGLIVTIGYSKAVREVLARGLRDVPPDRAPRVLVTPAAADRPFDAPRMAWDLCDDARARLRVAAGDAGVVAGLLEEGARVVLLLGAEAFDADGRALLARGTSERVRALRRGLERRGCPARVVLVAESWKRAVGLLSDDDFLGHHAQGLEIFGGPDDRRGADAILTDGDAGDGDADDAPRTVRIAVRDADAAPEAVGALYAAVETLLEACGLEQAADGGADPSARELVFCTRDGVDATQVRRRLARASELVCAGPDTRRERRDRRPVVRGARDLSQALGRFGTATVTIGDLTFASTGARSAPAGRPDTNGDHVPAGSSR